MPCAQSPPMSGRDAYFYIRDLVAGHVDLGDGGAPATALNSLMCAVNENDNLHTDIDDMARIIADLNKRLEAKKQVKFVLEAH